MCASFFVHARAVAVGERASVRWEDRWVIETASDGCLSRQLWCTRDTEREVFIDSAQWYTRARSPFISSPRLSGGHARAARRHYLHRQRPRAMASTQARRDGRRLRFSSSARADSQSFFLLRARACIPLCAVNKRLLSVCRACTKVAAKGNRLTSLRAPLLPHDLSPLVRSLAHSTRIMA